MLKSASPITKFMKFYEKKSMKFYEVHEIVRYSLYSKNLVISNEMHEILSSRIQRNLFTKSSRKNVFSFLSFPKEPFIMDVWFSREKGVSLRPKSPILISRESLQ